MAKAAEQAAAASAAAQRHISPKRQIGWTPKICSVIMWPIVEIIFIQHVVHVYDTCNMMY